jgi:glucuronate isomerase
MRPWFFGDDSGDELVLHDDRFFDSDPTVRRVARNLYDETRRLPIVSPHGHVDARIFADDSPFPEPAALIVVPDHYILRMLYSRGIALEGLGVAPRGGGQREQDPRKIWQLLGDHYHIFRGTPSAAWLDYELYHVFDVRKKLNHDTAQTIYDQIDEKLGSPEFRPRALFERFNIEVLATTDGAADALESHAALLKSGWRGRVIPTFRPDAVLKIASPEWSEQIAAVGRAINEPIPDYPSFVEALSARRAFFRTLGATATDHGVEEPYTERLPDDEADRLFTLALAGGATAADARRFEAHMLMEMARMSIEDGLVMQLHAGVSRNHNRPLFERFGADRGADIPITTEYTRNLRNLLSAYGNDSRLRVILFTLDEATYARELAPLAGHYPAVTLGPPWWFNDSIEGMTRFRQSTTETAGIYNTAGFNDDTRAFCSIPARHDLARRVDANWLAGLVARHVIDRSDASRMARALAYELAKHAYRLGDASCT